MQRSRLSFLVLALGLLASRALAHFPFVLVNEAGTEATVVLSETLEADPKVKTDRLAAGIKVWLRDAAGKDTPLTLERGDHSMKASLPAAVPSAEAQVAAGTSASSTRLIHGTADFGVRQRGQEPAYLLVYYPKALLGDPSGPGAVTGGDVPVELVPARADGGIRFRLLVGGKPAPSGREVKVIEPDGGQSTQKTDADGFTEKFSKPGRYGAWARHWVDEAGKRDEAAYTQRRLYATLVADYAARDAAPAPQASVRATPVATLPQGVSSFGAVALDGRLYVYGGHTATTHNYSTASVSGRFHRLDLRDGSGRWEELPGGPALQGMNLVAHRGAVYRVGGMSPRNAPGEPKDNNSTAEAARFDPASGRWKSLPPAPAARSSHDVAVVGNKLYAIGGWDQRGKGGQAAWLNHVDVLDLSAENKAWTRIPQPFVRRALVVAVLGEDVYVMGGFDENNQSQLDVDVLDTRTNTWRKGPPVPGERRNGFGPAACTAGRTIYLSVSTGEMFKLSDDRTRWELYAQATRRAVHRLVPDGSRILVVGGAANQKMVDLIEAVPVAGAPGKAPGVPAAAAR